MFILRINGQLLIAKEAVGAHAPHKSLANEIEFTHKPKSIASTNRNIRRTSLCVSSSKDTALSSALHFWPLPSKQPPSSEHLKADRIQPRFFGCVTFLTLHANIIFMAAYLSYIATLTRTSRNLEAISSGSMAIRKYFKWQVTFCRYRF